MGQLERDPAGQEPAGQAQLDRDRHSWTGTSYSHETGSRPTGFSFVYKYLLIPSRIESNKQCFHNQYMHTCLLRATKRFNVDILRGAEPGYPRGCCPLGQITINSLASPVGKQM